MRTRPAEHSETATNERGALGAYMRDLQRHPLLPREREIELAREYSKTRDPKIAGQLVGAHLRLVVKIAREYRHAHRDLADLIQEGNLGLLQAVQKYDPNRGFRLSTYAAWWIRAYMLRLIMENCRLVKVGTNMAQRKLFWNLHKEQQRLEAKGIEATDERLAERFAASEREVAGMKQRLGWSEVPLSTPVFPDGHARRTLGDSLESADLHPDAAAAGNQFRDLLRAKLSAFEDTLEGRDLAIFRQRLLAADPVTLHAFGATHGVSRERVRQVEAHLLGRLKAYLQRELGEAVRAAA